MRSEPTPAPLPRGDSEIRNPESEIGVDERVESLQETQLAILNILEDFNSEKLRLEDTQRAVLNILEDSDVEKSHIERTQRATFNILEDFNSEKLRLEDTQRAVLNILEDSDVEKSHIERTQRATFNILEDFNAEKLRLEDTQRALLNIMDDLNQSSEELKKAHDVLEVRVMERTAELRQRTEELGRSNAELEQFAYVASHDLQEPLRKIQAFGDRLHIRVGENKAQGVLSRLQSRITNEGGHVDELRSVPPVLEDVFIALS